MDLTADSYTATEAARVLKVSARRVRQLAEAGRLIVTQESPLRVSQLSVVALLEQRREQPAREQSVKPAGKNQQPSLAELVSALSEARAAGAQEARAALEAVSSEQRARAERAEQRAAEAEAALRVAESTKAALEARLETLLEQQQQTKKARKFLRF